MSKNMLIGIIVAVLLIGGVVWVMSQNKSTNNTAQNQTPQENQAMMEDKEGVVVGGAMMTPDRDIVTNAMDANNVTTLVAAVKAAGLVETLQGDGPFTVFAPTNAAFEKLPAGTVDTLLKPENKAQLSSILTYHVVPGRLRAADLTDGQTLTTVQGEMLTVRKNGNTVTVNGANIETADVISSNGVTHVIDTVMMPPSMSSGDTMER